MTQFLASVKDKQEALLALEGGVDIIDLKNPAEGALGALPLHLVRDIVRAINGRAAVSATVGDLPMEPALLASAAGEMAAAGVDIVKIGFFPSPQNAACIRELAPLARRGFRLVAVLFADLGADFGLLPELREAGFYGVMLDTAVKDGKSLPEHMSSAGIRHFLDSAWKNGLKTGLAGALRTGQVQELAAMQPDYLGFRSALCTGNTRSGHLDGDRLSAIRIVLHKRNNPVKPVQFA